MNQYDDNREGQINALIALFHEGDMNAVIPVAARLARELRSETAFNILALAHKKLNNYALAQDIYEKLLEDNPRNALFLGNLGNIFSDTGRLDKAEEYYKKCLEIEPRNYNTLVSLADVYVKKARLDEALGIYEPILKEKDKLDTSKLNDINFRVAEIYRSKGACFSERAIQHYNCSDNPLSSAHSLELTYRTKESAQFFKAEQKVIEAGECNPLLAAVQTHASIRYGSPDRNLFCRDPFSYISHSKLTLKEGFTDRLVQELLELKTNLDAIPQALLSNGDQSAGNLFLSGDPSVQTIKNIILSRIEKYRAHHSHSNEGFIKNWPVKSNIYGWIIELKRGGSLGSHMHKLGWLSGSLYLKLQKPLGSSQGNIIFDLDGADYPAESKSYPSQEFNIEEGDIVLFPSSIFHKTVPFESEKNRVTLAFDIKPVY